jgi:hypothetical protein
MNTLKLTAAAALVALAVGGTTRSCDIPTAPTDSDGTATVTSSEYERDSTNPATGTHYAECRAADGSEFRVVVSADTEYRLRTGQPCPDGPHVPTVRQDNPGLYDQIQSALNQPLPYSGGDPNGPCGSWAAADKADADQMRADWQRCMAAHGGTR